MLHELFSRMHMTNRGRQEFILSDLTRMLLQGNFRGAPRVDGFVIVDDILVANSRG